MNYQKSPYKELNIRATTVLGLDTSKTSIQKREKARRYYQEHKKIMEVINNGQAPGCIGNKTGGHW